MAKYTTRERLEILELYERALVQGAGPEEAQRRIRARLGRCPHALTLEKWRRLRARAIAQSVSWHQWLHSPWVLLLGFLSAILAIAQALVPGLSPASAAQIEELLQSNSGLSLRVADQAAQINLLVARNADLDESTRSLQVQLVDLEDLEDKTDAARTDLLSYFYDLNEIINLSDTMSRTVMERVTVLANSLVDENQADARFHELAEYIIKIREAKCSGIRTKKLVNVNALQELLGDADSVTSRSLAVVARLEHQAELERANLQPELTGENTVAIYTRLTAICNDLQAALRRDQRDALSSLSSKLATRRKALKASAGGSPSETMQPISSEKR